MVLFFGTHRVSEWHAWARVERGAIVRMYGYSGWRGETVADVGQPSADELALGIDIPSEEDVLAIATAWSVDPRNLDDEAPSGDAILARLGSISDHVEVASAP